MQNYTVNEINPYVIHCGYLNSLNCLPSGTVYEKRTVKWHELELMLWGEGYIITEGKKLFAKKGDIFYRKPGMAVQGVAPYYCYIILFDMVYDRGRMNLYNEQEIMDAGISIAGMKDGINLTKKAAVPDFPESMNTRQFHRYRELFETVYNEFICHSGQNQLLLKTCLLQIMLLLYTEWMSTAILQNSSRSVHTNFIKVAAAKEFMDVHSASKVMLSEIAEAVDLSPNFLCRIFKSITGMSPIAYLNTNKINHAKKLLSETNMSVKEISYECGFENDTYFYSLFRKMEGITPSMYRQKQRSVFL